MSDAEKKNPPSLLEGNLKRSEYERTEYRVKTKEGETLEDVLAPEYWTHVGYKLRPFDKIEVVFHDGSRYLELIVVDCAKLWAKVAIIVDKSLADEAGDAIAKREAEDGEGPYFVKFVSPTLRYCIIRRSDNQRVAEGYAGKKEATDKMLEFIKTMAA